MRLARKSAICALALAPLLGGCATQEQSGALMGGGAGAIAGGVLGGALGGRTGALLGAAIGGTAGAFAGSAVGRRLDDQDRARAQTATQQALSAPVTYSSASATSAPPPRPVVWNSAQNQGISGTSAVTSVQRQSDGGECRLVRETAYIKGEEVVQNNRYCRGTDGQWVARS